MSGDTYDGPTLRAVRESMGVPLRRIARAAGMSHGHLSKVERGEYGRPVTPAILAAYERVTSVRLDKAVSDLAEREAGGEAAVGRRPKTWRGGQMTAMRRKGYNSGIAALAIGGHLGEPYQRLVDSTGRPLAPAPPGLVEVEQLEQFNETAIAQDLRYGGALAHRTAWAAFDTAAHEPARSLFRLALFAAVRAADANLRAHVLADVAAQQNHVGYPEDALEIIRLVEGDERVAPLVRMIVQGVKARAFAALGDADACRRCVAAAEQHHRESDWPSPEGWHWVQSLCHPRHLSALTGHAFADLAAASSSREDIAQAIRRLAEALDDFDPVSHGRAHVLCATRLAWLLLDVGDLDRGTYFGHLALRSVAQVRSARLTRKLAAVRTKAASLGEEPAMRKLAEAIEDAQRASLVGGGACQGGAT